MAGQRQKDLQPLMYTGAGMGIGLAAGLLISFAGNKTTVEVAKIPEAVEKPVEVKLNPPAPPDAATRRDMPPDAAVHREAPPKPDAPTPIIARKLEFLPLPVEVPEIKLANVEKPKPTVASHRMLKPKVKPAQPAKKAPAHRLRQSKPAAQGAAQWSGRSARPRLLGGRRCGRRFGRW